MLETKSTDLGGIKSATAVVSGPGAFGQLRWENGVHRATMVPDNDKHGRMQTGTAVVIAMPEASDVSVCTTCAVCIGDAVCAVYASLLMFCAGGGVVYASL